VADNFKTFSTVSVISEPICQNHPTLFIVAKVITEKLEASFLSGHCVTMKININYSPVLD